MKQKSLQRQNQFLTLLYKNLAIKQNFSKFNWKKSDVSEEYQKTIYSRVAELQSRKTVKRKSCIIQNLVKRM